MSIKITEIAIKNAQEKMAGQGFTSDITYLRIGVKGGGCSGLSYLLEFDSAEITALDLIFEIGKREMNEQGACFFVVFERDKYDGDDKIEMPFRIVTDKKSYLYLNGATLDYVAQGLQDGFIFINPGAGHHCGCGTSFSTEK